MRWTCFMFVIVYVTVLPGLAGALECSNDLGSCELTESDYRCECTGGWLFYGEWPPGAPPTEADCLQGLDGFCAGFDVLERCEDDRGYCEVYVGGWSCLCAQENLDDSQTDTLRHAARTVLTSHDGTMALDDGIETCEQLMNRECPEPPPVPEDVCQADDLSFCEELVDWVGVCEEEDAYTYEYLLCCMMTEIEPEHMDAYWECLQEFGCDDYTDECSAVADSPVDGDDSGTPWPYNPPVSDGDDSVPDGSGSVDDRLLVDDSASSDSQQGPEPATGCRSFGSGASWILLVAVALLGITRRYRRRRTVRFY